MDRLKLTLTANQQQEEAREEGIISSSHITKLLQHLVLMLSCKGFFDQRKPDDRRFTFIL